MWVYFSPYIILTSFHGQDSHLDFIRVVLLCDGRLVILARHGRPFFDVKVKRTNLVLLIWIDDTTFLVGASSS